MNRSLRLKDVGGLAGILVLIFGATEVTAQTEIVAEGSAKVEIKSVAGRAKFEMKEALEGELHFSNGVQELHLTRTLEIEDPFDFFLKIDCEFNAQTVEWIEAIQLFDPPGYEYHFIADGDVTLSTEFPWGSDEFSNPNRARVKLTDVLAEPPLDRLEIYLEPEEMENPIYVECSSGPEFPHPRPFLDVAVAVTP
ncbi:MAG: hypothetical protein GTO71_04905 [Woeseiaceae bacterium]|nr:hypothetical protein [Woeseiaceae bacterium]NIP20438.1 hypothetical protein [Woeseiaceae bacterium]NIS89327.1 hypothetical protein [Woeseiaceae bacterium]